MAETFEAYRTRVLSYLGDEEPIGVQQATPSQLDRRLRDVAPEELIRRPAPEKWSIAEIVAHLADAELAMGWRLRNMLANPGVALTWWDEAAWAERLGYAQQDASLSAGVFRALRASNLRLLASVLRARWVECYGVHEVRGRQTVEEFVRLEAAHDLNHLRQIDRILGGCMQRRNGLSVYETLQSLKIELPALTKPVAAFVPFTRVGALVFVSGHIAMKNGKPWEGQLGANLTIEQGKEAAKGVAIDLIATLNAAVGDLNLIRRIVKMQVLVNSTPAFTGQHLVANGASELLVAVFGDGGAHARAAFGVAQIPFGSCVEIDLIAEVDDK